MWSLCVALESVASSSHSSIASSTPRMIPLNASQAACIGANGNNCTSVIGVGQGDVRQRYRVRAQPRSNSAACSINGDNPTTWSKYQVVMPSNCAVGSGCVQRWSLACCGRVGGSFPKVVLLILWMMTRRAAVSSFGSGGSWGLTLMMSWQRTD